MTAVTKISGEAISPEERHMVELTRQCAAALRARIAVFMDHAGAGPVSSNAIIAALQLLLADQLAIHSVGQESSRTESQQLMEATVSAMAANFEHSYGKWRARLADFKQRRGH